MKNILMVAAALGFMTSSIMAADTTITQIWVKADAIVLYMANDKICSAGVNNNMTAEYTQQFLATALTAHTSNATVNVNIAGADCKNIFLK